LVIISIVLFFLIFGYFLALVIGGFDLTILGDKVPLVRILRLLFIRLFGWEVPLIILLCLLSGLDEYTLNMMDPAGGQPAANPAAEQPSDGASTSGWISFEEGVLLQSMPSSNESSEASVNQQPVIPELEPPLLDDNSRREELAARLRANWWGVAYNERILDSFVQSQLSIERHVEAALVADGYSPQVVFERRHTIRGFLFYPEGRALQGGTYAGYLSQIANFGTRQSVPYQRLIRSVRNSNLFLE
jgi:photosystem II P680 reaction center D1 protein